MKFYEIEQAILDCCDMETGEIIDIDRLRELQMEREAKIDNLACWYKTLCAEAEAIKIEKLVLEARQKQKNEQADRLKEFLSNVCNGHKFETPRCKISWRKSKSVLITDESKISDDYMKIIKEPRKTDIKEAIEAGIVIEGAEIQEKSNIQIK